MNQLLTALHLLNSPPTCIISWLIPELCNFPSRDNLETNIILLLNALNVRVHVYPTIFTSHRTYFQKNIILY